MKLALLVVLPSVILHVALCLTSQELAQFQGEHVTAKYDGTNIIVYSNGTPDHETEMVNPNTVEAQNYVFTVPNTPKILLGNPGCLPMSAIGVAINGVPFFNPYTGEGFNAVEGDNREIFDSCEGHPSPFNEYHYHHVPVCLPFNMTDQLLGVAFDGYPIYGPVRGDGKTMTSADLDECHGTTYNGQYRYYITKDFPYILGCYRAEAIKPDTKDNVGGPAPPNGSSPSPSGGPPPPNGGGNMEMEDQCYYAFDAMKGITVYPTSGYMKTQFSLIFVIVMLYISGIIMS